MPHGEYATSSNSVYSETLSDGSTRLAVVAAAMPAPPPPMTTRRSPISGLLSHQGREARRPLGALALEQRRDRLSVAPRRRLGKGVRELAPQVLHGPLVGAGQVE